MLRASKVAQQVLSDLTLLAWHIASHTINWFKKYLIRYYKEVILKGDRSDSEEAVYCASANNPKIQSIANTVKLRFHFKTL